MVAVRAAGGVALEREQRVYSAAAEERLRLGNQTLRLLSDKVMPAFKAKVDA